MRVRIALAQVRLGLMGGLIKVPERNLERSLEAALNLFEPLEMTGTSAYLEFGVFVGTSMACMSRATERVGATDLRLVGFDSFQGMPTGEERDSVWTWQPGQLYSDIKLTRANLRRQGVPLSRVTLVPGWFKDSLTHSTLHGLGIDRAVIIMMDCVLESSTRTALEFCTPLIRDRTVIFFDDWSAAQLAERGMGEARAFGDWLEAHPEMSAVEAPELSYEKDCKPFIVSRRTATDLASMGSSRT